MAHAPSSKASSKPTADVWRVDGSEYVGDFFADRIHGTGRLVSCDGGWYEGEWSHGVRHGRGVSAGPGGGAGVEQEWRSGKPVGDPADPGPAS